MWGVCQRRSDTGRITLAVPQPGRGIHRRNTVRAHHAISVVQYTAPAAIARPHHHFRGPGLHTPSRGSILSSQPGASLLPNSAKANRTSWTDQIVHRNPCLHKSKRQPEPTAMIDTEATCDAIRLSRSPVPIRRSLDVSGRWKHPFEAEQVSPED